MFLNFLKRTGSLVASVFLLGCSFNYLASAFSIRLCYSLTNNQIKNFQSSLNTPETKKKIMTLFQQREFSSLVKGLEFELVYFDRNGSLPKSEIHILNNPNNPKKSDSSNELVLNKLVIYIFSDNTKIGGIDFSKLRFSNEKFDIDNLNNWKHFVNWGIDNLVETIHTHLQLIASKDFNDLVVAHTQEEYREHLKNKKLVQELRTANDQKEKTITQLTEDNTAKKQIIDRLTVQTNQKDQLIDHLTDENTLNVQSIEQLTLQNENKAQLIDRLIDENILNGQFIEQLTLQNENKDQRIAELKVKPTLVISEPVIQSSASQQRQLSEPVIQASFAPQQRQLVVEETLAYEYAPSQVQAEASSYVRDLSEPVIQASFAPKQRQLVEKETLAFESAPPQVQVEAPVVSNTIIFHTLLEEDPQPIQPAEFTNEGNPKCCELI